MSAISPISMSRICSKQRHLINYKNTNIFQLCLCFIYAALIKCLSTIVDNIIMMHIAQGEQYAFFTFIQAKD